MVNVVREPHITPGRPRVSSGASNSLSRVNSASDATMSAKSRIPRLSAASTVTKRPVLGEMSDNLDIASSQQSIRPRSSTTKGGKLVIKARVSKAHAPSPAAQTRQSVLASSPRVISSPPGRLLADETQLLDTTMDLPELSETDASDGEDPNAGLRQLLRQKSRITPPSSQEASVPKSSAVSRPSNHLPVSHLPTPPPSQTNFLVTPPRSSLSQRRPRPSVTPPRQDNAASSSRTKLLSPAEITEPSPNPRRKKASRTSRAQEEDTRSTPQPTIRRGKSRTSLAASSSSSQSSQPNPSTAPTARKPRTSRPRKSVASPKVASPNHTPRQSRKSSVGLSGELPKSAQSLTPAGKKLVRAGGSTLLKKAIRATPGEDPLLLGGWDEVSSRGKSKVGAGDDHADVNDDEVRDEEEEPLPLRDKGKGRAIVFPSPLSQIASPGLPAIAKHPNNDLSASLSRFVADLPDPLADETMGFDGGFDDGGFGSASEAGDYDESMVGNDTFYHVRARQQSAASIADEEVEAAEETPLETTVLEPTINLDANSNKTTREPSPSRPIAAESQEDLQISIDSAGTSFAQDQSDALEASFEPTTLNGSEQTSPLATLEQDVAALLRSQFPTPEPVLPSAPSSAPTSPAPPNEYLDYIAPLAGGEPSEDEGDASERAADSETDEAVEHTPDADVTLEGTEEDWNISGESMENGAAHDANTARAPMADSSTAAEDAPADESSSEEEEPLEESTTSDDSAEAERSQIAELAASLSAPAPPAAAAPERIVLRIVPKGIIKIEPESTDASEEQSPPTCPPAVVESTSTPAQRVEAGGAIPTPVEVPPSSEPAPAPPLTPEKATGASANSTTPTSSPSPRAQRLPFVAPPAPSQPPTSKVERIPIRTVASKIPSKLSQQWTAESPDRSSQSDLDASTSLSSPLHQPQPTTSRSTAANHSIRISSNRPALLEELAASQADASFTSVVEISSLDPRAAARAAAILKMNHAYIEHGDVPKGSTPRHTRRRSLHQSQHFETVEASRLVSKEELLHEAELEIVSTHRGRSMSVFSDATGITGITRRAATDLAVPGAWIDSPKRKRQSLSKLAAVDLESEINRSKKGNGKAWTVKDWKRLERVFIAEKKAWVQEREVKQMPGGFTSWATRSFRAPEKVKEWDAGRVVERFLEEVNAQDGVGEWSREVVALRVAALERRVASKMEVPPSDDLARQSPSPKKRRYDSSDTPAKEVLKPSETPSTLSKVFGFMWSPWSTRKPAAVATPSIEAEVKAPAVRSRPIAAQENLDGSVRDKGKQRLHEPLMKEIRRNALPLQTLHSKAAVVPSPPALTEVQPKVAPLLPSHAESSNSRIKAWTQAIPSTASLAPLATSSSSSTTAPPTGSSSPRIYPPLPSITQRSAALKALFPAIHPLNDSTSSTASAGSVASISSPRSQPISIPKRSSSIQDLVKSFEEAKTLDKALELRRSQSATSLRREQ